MDDGCLFEHFYHLKYIEYDVHVSIMLYVPEGMLDLHTASVESVLGTLMDIEGFSSNLSEWEVGSA